MANAKEIKTKIASVQNTQKITSAMEMVAASKMRKAQERMTMSRPYADRIQEVIKHVSTGNLEYQHPFTKARKTKKVGILVISTDRGLCGGLNINLFKNIIGKMEQYDKENIKVELATIGAKAFGFFKRFNVVPLAHVNQLGDAPVVKDLVGIIGVMLEAFNDGKIDELWVSYNSFVNTMTQTPMLEKLLPIIPNAEEVTSKRCDYLYEPSPEPLLNSLLSRYIESLMYQAIVENVASEQAARMIAMKSATDNAGDIINELQLVYNKARQAAITQELSEIAGGAAAV